MWYVYLNGYEGQTGLWKGKKMVTVPFLLKFNLGICTANSKLKPRFLRCFGFEWNDIMENVEGLCSIVLTALETRSNRTGQVSLKFTDLIWLQKRTIYSSSIRFKNLPLNRVADTMVAPSSSVRVIGACGEVNSCDAGCQEVSRCSTRSGFQGMNITFASTKVNKAAQRRCHQKSKTGAELAPN